jgi:5'(3')-deoxyribonucleotidase
MTPKCVADNPCTIADYCGSKGYCVVAGSHRQAVEQTTAPTAGKRLVIAVDVDDVVADLITEWLRRYNRDYQDTLTQEHIKAWEIDRFVKPECGTAIFQYLASRTLYDCVKPVYGALEGVQRLRLAGHRVVFVTSSNAVQAGRKMQWLQRHGFLGDSHEQPDYYVANDKSLIAADLLIDDRPKNVERFPGRTILFARPHNEAYRQTAIYIDRVGIDWPHILGLVEVIACEELDKCAAPMATLAPVVAANAAPVADAAKETNPKDAIGTMKLPLHLVSGTVKAYDALAHFLGNVKYGAWNYRAAGSRASVYRAALDRHLDRWWDAGEECDPVDETPHLANAKACLNILIEGIENGNLVDDRPPSNKNLPKLYERFEGIMRRIVERYKDKRPRHYTIADTLK